MRAVMLTTVDNPFNPFDNFLEWYKIDMQFQYNTCALLARIAPNPVESLPDSYNEMLKEKAIDDWVAKFPLTYKKVVSEEADIDYESLLKQEEEAEKAYDE